MAGTCRRAEDAMPRAEAGKPVPPAEAQARRLCHQRLMHEIRRGLDGLDNLADLEGLFEEGVEAHSAEALGLAVGEFAAHGDDAGHLEVVVLADDFRNRAGIAGSAIAEVDVEEDDVRLEALALHAGLEGAEI